MIPELALVLSLAAVVVAGIALVQALAAQRRVDVHKAHLAEHFDKVDKRLTEASTVPLESLARMAVDATASKATGGLDWGVLAAQAGVRLDLQDGDRDYTDAQIRLACDAEIARRRS